MPSNQAAGAARREHTLRVQCRRQRTPGAVRDHARMRPEFIRIGGRSKWRAAHVNAALYRAILDEAHELNVPVAAHNVKLADFKD